MAIKNLMEDIVTTIVDEVLKKKSKNNADNEIKISKDDIITYVLNRIPPKYFTSERGILHGKLESQVLFQQKTDILLLTYEAIKTIKERRESALPPGIDKIGEKEYFLPHVIGEVLEETTFSIVSGIKVTLIYNDKPAEMIDPSWKNPYITNKATRGFYHFWPKLVEQEKEKKKIPFQIKYSHPKFEEDLIGFDLGIVHDRNFYKSHIMPTVLLKVLEGVDISFLND